MRIQSVKISRMDSISNIEINGKVLENVLDYKVESSADGTTELQLKIDISETFMEFEMSASQTEPTSLV